MNGKLSAKGDKGLSILTVRSANSSGHKIVWVT